VPITILAFVGIYAASIFPDTFAPFGDTDPMSAFGVVLKALPIGVAALALIGALAASISTSTTALMGASSTAVRDIYQRFIRPNATSEQLTMPSKIITLILGGLVWLLTFYPGGPLYLFAFSTAWLGAPSVLVFLGVWWKRTTKAGAFYGAVIGMSVTALFTILQFTGIYDIDEVTHIGVVGLVVTVLTTVIISLFSEPNYYSKEEWNKHAESFDALNEKEIQTLNYIAEGYNTMAEITDLFSVDSSKTNAIIESLDKKQLIKRNKYSGPGFYTFSITEIGYNHITTNVDTNTDMTRYITEDEKTLLHYLNIGPEATQEYINDKKIDSLKVSVLLSKLIRQGLLKEAGLWNREVIVTPAAKNILAQGRNDEHETFNIQ